MKLSGCIKNNKNIFSIKKALIALLVVAFISFSFSGCKSNSSSSNDAGNKSKLSIVSTIFPGYDFAKQVCGNDANVTLLLPPGSESHTYEPSAQDIIKIQNCDLFIYVGGESDTWVEKILSSLSKPIKTIKMMDCVTALEEELKEGMEGENDSDEKEYDEHVWTSPVNAAKIVKAITDSLCEIKDENAQQFKANSAAYTEKINNLDTEFKNFFSTVKNKTLIFGDRFPLRYFVDEYGLDYYAAFPGCSEDTEPSAKTVAFLIDKVKELNVSTVFYIEFSSHKIADSIAQSTETKTAQFNTCHNVSNEQMENGATYVSLMEENLKTLKDAMK